MKQSWKDNEVAPADRCPGCNECRVDYLVWDKDGVEVTCATCGRKYQPEGGA